MDCQPAGSHFIDGVYCEDTKGREIAVIYPANGQKVATIFAATPKIIEAAVASALRAQAIWARWAPVERGRVLRKAADIIRARNRELSELETMDTGKPLQETLAVDATSGAEALEFFGGICPTINGEYIPLGDDFVYSIREALGVCVGLGAWNYPTQIACWKGAPALACGNAMIFKPSETTPLCALKIAEIMIEAGAPSGLYNVIQGDGPVGAALASHPKIDKVSLTGSVSTGKKVYAAAAQGIKHVTMELGGKSPLIIFDDADIEDAVGGAMLGNFYSSGQVCSNGTRVFVHEAIKARFLERLRDRTNKIIIGDPMDEATQMGPLVSQAQFDKVMGYIAIGKQSGARVVCGGEAIARDGFYVQPTIFCDVQDDMQIAQEEIFGPVMSVLDFTSEDEVVARANASEFGLSAGLFTRDLTRAHRMAKRLQAGNVWINTYNLAPVEAPFGGAKLSGVGRENSREALNAYSQTKGVYVAMGSVDSPY